jgi:hypothetical protein
MRVETAYVPVEGEPEKWRRKLARLLGRGLMAQLAAGGQVAVFSPVGRAGKALLSEEAGETSDKGRVVEEASDSEE